MIKRAGLRPNWAAIWFSPMLPAAAHRENADAHPAAIYRAMTPTQRLQQAVRMNRQMRSLMDAGLRAQYPDWTATQRQREIAQRVLHARTG